MIANLTNKRYISRNPFFAIRFGDRLRGMIGRKFYDCGFDAMVFRNCNCIHTMFMGQRIDVIFLDAENRVVGLRENLACYLPCVRCANAATVVELPAGTISHSGTEKGHVINVFEESVPETLVRESKKQIVGEIKSVVPFKREQ